MISFQERLAEISRKIDRKILPPVVTRQDNEERNWSVFKETTDSKKVAFGLSQRDAKILVSSQEARYQTRAENGITVPHFYAKQEN